MLVRKLLLAAACLTPYAASAQQAPRPGLWEHWMTPKLEAVGPNSDAIRMLNESNRQTKARLAGLPPEKREAIEKEMAAAGVDLRLSKPDGVMSAQHCMTAKEAARMAAEQEQQKENCPRTVTQQGEGITVVSMACREADPARPSKVTFTFYGNKAYSVDAPIGTISARWLRDDCNGIQ